MAKQNYEQAGIIGRIKEYGVLYLFIILSAVTALVVMNILVFPVAVSAVHKPHLFSAVVKYGILAAAAVLILLTIISTARRWIASDKGIMAELALTMKRKGSSFLFFLIVLFSGIVLSVAVYLLLTYNYRLLYEILN
jgi:hypothetical protein